MRVTLSWLREFAAGINGDAAELSEVLSALGLAVERSWVTGTAPEGVVVARVVALRPHPGADRIQLVDVDIGSGEPLQVCCGAFNMVVGDLVAFASIGTVMPNGVKIARRLIRGQVSEGMCCSAAEIELGDDRDQILVLNDLVTPRAEPGMSLGAACGYQVDVVWDLDVGANRPDAMSVAGVARDLAAALGVRFSYPAYAISTTDESIQGLIDVEIVDRTLCGRFVATVLRNVTIGKSPLWMQNRLTQLGMRSVNSIVDISNYVMLELGQPNHAFDLARITDGQLRIRRAHRGEKLVTLDGLQRELCDGEGVIADGTDEVISLAGVMGGARTEISESTTDVLLEMAWWDPPSISRTAKRMGLVTEAATRNRRGVDWGQNLDRAMRRFIALAAESGVTAVDGFVDVAGNTPDRSPQPVRTRRINSLLGTTLTADNMADLLRPIGFGVQVHASGDSDTSGDGGSGDDVDLSVTIPTWRLDTETETDIAEEVARMYGYERIQRTVPIGKRAAALTPKQVGRRLVRDVLVGLGCDETLPMPFLAPGDLARAGMAEDGITLTNPLHALESVLRTSLLPGQLKAVAYNQSHRSGDVRFFQIDHVFLAPREGRLLPDEREHLAVALACEEAPEAVAVLDTITKALAVENPELQHSSPPGLHRTRAAHVMVAGKVIGVVGEIDPEVLDAFGVDGPVAWIELDLGALLDGPRGARSYRRVSKFPSSDIDLAFVVPESVQAAQIESRLRRAGGSLLVDLGLFDVYRDVGDGYRSLGYRLRFQAEDRTLTDAEIAQVRRHCIAEVTNNTGSTLRR